MGSGHSSPNSTKRRRSVDRLPVPKESRSSRGSVLSAPQTPRKIVDPLPTPSAPVSVDGAQTKSAPVSVSQRKSPVQPKPLSPPAVQSQASPAVVNPLQPQQVVEYPVESESPTAGGGDAWSPSNQKEAVSFHEALTVASQQLRLRQREGDANLTKSEMEDLVMLTREMENLKKMMKKSQFTVEGTWKIIEKEGLLERFGQLLYDELLTKNPRLRVFFYGVDLDEQSRTLIRMLGTAVHFYEKPQITIDMFAKAGARHRGYGITSSVFLEMEKAFFKVFPKFVGQDVFEASREEWKKFWALVLDLLDHGSHSAEGERYGKMHEEQTLKKLQHDFKLIAERQGKCDLRHQFIGTMYAKAIEMNGDLSKFEALKDLRASRRVFQAIGDIINNFGDHEKIVQYMEELGSRHIAYGVTAEDLRAFTDPFLFTCRHFLQDEWNISTEARFQWVFESIIKSLSDGIDSGSVSDSTEAASFCLVFTDIEGSSKLWQKDPKSMGAAVKRHHKIVRTAIAQFGAYEVKTVGDSFIIAAKDVFFGLKMALAIQLELMRAAPIAPDFEMLENTEGRGDPNAWNKNTLRVRIGIEHCTDATATYDNVHRRYDYYGPSVNRCARIENAACGGQILMSREAFEMLKAIPDFHDEPCSPALRSVNIQSTQPDDDKGVDHFVSVSDAGVCNLKGIPEPVHLVSIVPSCLSGRQFVDKVSHQSD